MVNVDIQPRSPAATPGNTLARHLLLVVAITVQGVRVLHGVDFNDEMQYYGEILALAESRHLFSTDMFLQQTVYVLLYPLIRGYHALFGTDSMILAGRALFAAFIVWIFLRVRDRLLLAETDEFAAGVAALAVTFAVPIYNIYAISYNTVALGILAVCFAEMFAWRTDRRIRTLAFWLISIVCLVFTYPPLGAAMALVVVARSWLLGDHRSAVALVATLIPLVLLAAWALLQFAPFDEYLEAIAFSRAFSVGETIFKSGLPILLSLCVVVVAVLVLTNRPALPSWLSSASSGRGNFAAVTVGAICLLATADATAHAVWFASLVVAVTAFALTSWPLDDAQRRTRNWMTVLFLMTCVVMVATSSNGIRQIHGPAMLAAPFFVALVLRRSSGTDVSVARRKAASVLGIGMVTVFVAVYLWNPYRDEPLWNQTESTQAAPAFRHLRLTSNKVAAIKAIRDVLADIPAKSSVLVLGAHPWIYFATDTLPDTDMVFMHFTGGLRAYEILASRLQRRQPDFIVVSAVTTDNVHRAFEKISVAGRYTCKSIALEEALQAAAFTVQTYYNMNRDLVVCRLPKASAESQARSEN
jgi:hypothetical protein